METEMAEHTFKFGDHVRHAKRPEWGVGLIIKTEDTAVNGQPQQRITVRFPNAGLKRLMSGHALLQRVDEQAETEVAVNGNGAAAGFQQWDRLTDSDWLSPVAQRKVQEMMTTLPEEIRDPFNGLGKQLAATLSLYRFDKSGRGLIDWAVAQSGLDDPLSRFTRQELEQLFDRWTRERDNHLEKLLASARDEPEIVRDVVRNAPPAARAAVKKLHAMR